jgi:hypothetical protein
MTRAKTAAAAAAEAPGTPLEMKAGAVARVWARRRVPRFAEYPDGRGGVFRWQIDAGTTDFTEPQNVSEWCDDRLARCCPGTPATDVLTEIFERIRVGGIDAVPAAVELARPLDDYGKFGCWMVLNGLPGGPAGVDSVRAQLARRWKAHHWPVAPPPAPVFGADRMDLDSPRPGPVKYRSERGHPAGPAV